MDEGDPQEKLQAIMQLNHEMSLLISKYLNIKLDAEGVCAVLAAHLRDTIYDSGESRDVNMIQMVEVLTQSYLHLKRCGRAPKDTPPKED